MSVTENVKKALTGLSLAANGLKLWADIRQHGSHALHSQKCKCLHLCWMCQWHAARGTLDAKPGE